MPFSYDRAIALVGKPRTEYQCNHVVNEVLNSNKIIGGRAIGYLKYGRKVLVPSTGTVVVGKDGVHVGIFISDTEFIHSSVRHHQVVKAPLSQLQYVFPGGYEFRQPF